MSDTLKTIVVLGGTAVGGYVGGKIIEIPVKLGLKKFKQFTEKGDKVEPDSEDK